MVDEYGNPVPQAIVEADPANTELVQTISVSKAIADANGWFELRVDTGRGPDGRPWLVEGPGLYIR